MSNALRPMTLGELLDRTFFLYRRHFLVFVGVVALPGLVVLAAQLGVLAIQRGTLARAFIMLALALLSVAVVAVSQGATVIALSNIHLGRPVAIGEAFAAIKGRIAELAFIMIAVGFLTAIGFVFLIIPGILLMLRWSLVVPVAVLEQEPLRQAMARSAQLTAGHRGRIFMIYFLYFVLLMVFYAAWDMPIAAAAAIAGRRPEAMSVPLQILMQAGNFLMQSLVGPLLTIALALVYYDERVRKEAFDLEHMIAELDRAGRSTATA